MSIKSLAKKAAAALSSTKAIPYVLKDNYLQVTIPGSKPFALDNTHPTFERMKKALQAKNWKAVPGLVTLAQSMFSASQGNIEVKNGVVYYKGSAVDTSLTQRIIDMVKGKKDFAHMLKFMDNLYKNPDPIAVGEFFDWLRSNDLPITDDGCFLAYKSVDSNYKDEHTHTISNRPGQVIMMPRAAADTNYRNQCSYGFHICSKQYGLYGSKVMAVKVNPRDVIAANDGKMRVLRYEVLSELGSPNADLFKAHGFAQLEKQVVVEITAERKELIQLILAAPNVKRLLRQKKISKSTIQKGSYARLKSMAARYEVIAAPVTVETEKLAPLAAARKASGFTVGQVAKAMGATYKTVATLENQDEPNQARFDEFLTAIGKLKGLNLSRSAITYPVAVK